MRKKLLTSFLALAITAGAWAQQRTVTGRVTDANGAPVPNASVVVKGTTNGVTTDANGNYSISLNGDARTLVVSSVGFAETEYSIGNKAVINSTLNRADRSLDEVVVVGYGTQRKRDLTANVSSVRGAAVADKPVQTFDQALAGRATGVQITSPSGVLNSPPVFRIRGTNSISLSSYPLIVVDGVPTFTGDVSSTAAAGNALASINPSDIESMEIAKDAASTAIYGSRAANGVVFITTKKGRSGKPRVSYNAWMSSTNPVNLPKVFNAQQYIDFKTQAVANNPGASAVRFNLLPGVDVNWSDVVYRKNAFSHSHNLNVAGGGDATTYYLSVGYTAQEGIIQKNDFKRMNTLFNIDSKLGSVVSIGGKLSFSNERNLAATSSGSLSGAAFNTGGLGRLAFVLPPIVRIYNPDGSANINGSAIGSSNIAGISSLSYYNPQFLLDKNKSNNENNRLQANAYLQVKPVKWLTLRSTYGIDYLYADNDIYWSPLSGDGYSLGGYAFSGTNNNHINVWTNTAQFDYSTQNHNFNLLGGSELQKVKTRGYGIEGNGILDVDLQDIQSGFITYNPSSMASGENNLISVFGRLNYNYNNKYFISGNLRQDEYSALAVKKGVFWGLSAGWELAKENFWNDMGANNVFSSFRLRGSYGKVGNIGGIGDFASLSLFSPKLYGGRPAQVYSQVSNPNLQWETSKKADVGATLGMFKDRLNISATYYKNDIDGLILYVQQAPSTGLPTNPPLNVGTMYNKGWEFELRGNPLSPNSAVSWTSSLNLATNKNMVTSLAPGLNFILSATSTLESVNKTQAGYPVGMLWVVRTGGVDAETGKRIFINQQGTPVYYQSYAPSGTYNYSTKSNGIDRYQGPTSSTINQAADAVMYASPHPKYYGGWDNTFRFKGLELNVLTTFQGGNYIYYGSNAGLHDQRWWNNHIDMLTETWKAPGDAGKRYPKAVFNDNTSNGSAFPIDLNVFKGDFVKIKNLTLAYNFDRSLIEKARMSSLRVYASALNLATFTKYPGPDPEVSSNGNTTSAPGVDRNTVGNARTFTIGLNIGF